MGPLGQALGLAAGSFTAITAGVAGATFGLFELSKSAAESINSMNELADAAGTDIGTIAGLQEAFAKAGAGAGQLETAFRILNFQIANVWPEIQRDVRDAATTIEEDQIKIRDSASQVASSQDQVQSAFIKTEEAALSLSAAQRKLEESDISVRNSRLALADAHEKVTNAGRNAQAAQLSVEQAEYNLLLAQGGSRDKATEAQLKERSAEIALAEAKQRQIDLSKERERAVLAEKKAQLDLANAYDQQKQAALSLQKAQIDLNNAGREQERLADKLTLQTLQLREAQNKLKDDAKKNVSDVADLLSGVGNAFRDSEGKINTAGISADTYFKAIVLNAARAKAAGKDIADVAPPTALETLYKIAAAFQTITEQTERQAIARRALGRSASQPEIELLAKGEDNLKAEAAKGIETAQGLIDSKEAAEGFRSSLAETEIAFVRLRDKIGISFAPIFIEGLNKIRESLKANQTDIEAWVKNIKANVEPGLRDLFNILSGGEAKTSFGKDLVASFKGLEEIGKLAISAARAINQIVEALGGSRTIIEALVLGKIISWIGEFAGGVTKLEAASKALVAIDIAGWLAKWAPLAAILVTLEAIKVATAKPSDEDALKGEQIRAANLEKNIAARQSIGDVNSPQAIAQRQALAQSQAEIDRLKERLAPKQPGAARLAVLGGGSIQQAAEESKKAQDSKAADKQDKAAEDQRKAADIQLKASEEKGGGEGATTTTTTTTTTSGGEIAAPRPLVPTPLPTKTGLEGRGPPSWIYGTGPDHQLTQEQQVIEDQLRAPLSRNRVFGPGYLPSGAPSQLPGGGEASRPLGPSGPEVVTPPGAPSFPQPAISSPLGQGGPKISEPSPGAAPSVEAILRPLRDAFSSAGSQVKEAISPLKDAFEGEGPKIKTAAALIADALRSGAQQIAQAAQAIKGSGSSSSAPGGTESTAFLLETRVLDSCRLRRVTRVRWRWGDTRSRQRHERQRANHGE